LAEVPRFRFRMFFSGAPRPSAFLGFLHGAHVGKVLRSARSELGGNKIVFRNKERGKTGRRVKHSFNPAFPGGIKINAGKFGENIEPYWVASKTFAASALMNKSMSLVKRCA